MDYIYNLVLEAGHMIDISGVLAVTLAHGFKDEARAHTFWGTERVVEVLQLQREWPSVTINTDVEMRWKNENECVPDVNGGRLICV